MTHLPASEFASADRLFFQIEQAHWYYEDFLVDAPGASLPHMHLRVFGQNVFARCGVLQPLADSYEQLFASFREYKGKIPVCGCILLDESMTKVVLVRNWQKTSWGLPKGKVNQHEPRAACAAREVLEETGFDVGEAIDDRYAIEVVNDAQHTTMFVVGGVPLDYPFRPRVRKEISKVAFFPLDALPNDQWNVDRFVPKLRRLLKQHKRKGGIAMYAAPSCSGGGEEGEEEEEEDISIMEPQRRAVDHFARTDYAGCTFGPPTAVVDVVELARVIERAVELHQAQQPGASRAQ